MQVQVQNAEFSAAPCFASEQARLNAFSALQYVELDDELFGLIVSPDQPSVEDQDKLWLQTDAFNNPIQFFLFSSQYAAWLWPHPTPPSDPRLILYTGAAGDVDTLDGGDALAVTETTGPFWEIETEFTDRLPIGAGTVPVNTNSQEFDDDTPNYPEVRGVYFLSRTARKYILA